MNNSDFLNRTDRQSGFSNSAVDTNSQASSLAEPPTKDALCYQDYSNETGTNVTWGLVNNKSIDTETATTSGSYKTEYQLTPEQQEKLDQLYKDMETTDYIQVQKSTAKFFKPFGAIRTVEQYLNCITGFVNVSRNSQMNYFDPSIEQYRAIASPAQFILIPSGAGTGKTALMVHKIQYEQFLYGYSDVDILCCSYTDAAAQSLKQKYDSIKSDYASAVNIDAVTLHSFCTRLINNTKGYNIITEKDPYVYTEFDEETYEPVETLIYLEELLKDAAIRLFPQRHLPSVKSILSAISIIEERRIETDEQLRTIEKFSKYPLTFKDIKAIQVVFKANKENYGLMDYTDSLVECYLFLKSLSSLEDLNDRPTIKRMLIKKAIYIDEYQDISPLQDLIIDELIRLNPSCRLICIGDCDQAIYSFRGASVYSFLNFGKKYIDRDVDIIALTINRRSAKEIVNVANLIIEHNKMRITKKMRAFNNELVGHIGYIVDTTPQKLIHRGYLINYIKKMYDLTEGQMHDINVLYREHLQIKPYILQLIKLKIPFNVSTRGINSDDLFPFNYADVKNIILAASTIMQSSNLDLVNKYLRYLVPGLTPEDTNYIVSTLRSNPEIKLLAILKSNPKYANYVEPLKKIYLGIKEKEDSSIVFGDLISLYKEAVINPKLCKSGANVTKINIEFNLACEYLTMFPDLDFNAFLTKNNQIKQWCSQSINLYRAVQFKTTHAAKGLEGKTVIALGISDETTPKKGLLSTMSKENAESYIEEERRLFYVLITRAISNLTLLFEDNGLFAQEFISACQQLGLPNEAIE